MYSCCNCFIGPVESVYYIKKGASWFFIVISC